MKRSENGVVRRIACERAYRRGYIHGVRIALQWLYGAMPLTPEMDVIVPRLRQQSEANLRHGRSV